MQGVQPSRAAVPWGTAAALLSGCFATLAGALRGVDPEIVLVRAVVAAAIVGVTTHLAVRVFELVRRSS